MWTNIDELKVKSGTFIYCEAIPNRMGIVKSINERVIYFADGFKCGMGKSMRIYVPKNQPKPDQISEHFDKLKSMFLSKDSSNIELAASLLEAINAE